VRLDGELMLGESPSHRPCLLRTEVLWLELLVLVQLPQVLLGRLVDDCEHAGDCLANIAYLGQLGRSSSSHLGNAKLREFRLELIELLSQLLLLLSAKILCLYLAHV